MEFDFHIQNVIIRLHYHYLSPVDIAIATCQDKTFGLNKAPSVYSSLFPAFIVV